MTRSVSASFARAVAVATLVAGLGAVLGACGRYGPPRRIPVARNDAPAVMEDTNSPADAVEEAAQGDEAKDVQ